MMTTLAVIGLAILSALLYRCGGAGKVGDRWDFLRDSWIRDCFCSLITTVAIGLWSHWSYPWWSYVVHWGLLYGALSTYWDFLAHDNKNWITWLCTGFAYGVAAFVFPIIWMALIRAVVLAVATAVWRQAAWPWLGGVNDAVSDETGVGFILVASVMIL